MNTIPDSFWHHIEELRLTFIRCLTVIFIGFLFSLYFYKEIFQLLTLPLSELDLKLVILSPVEGFSSAFKIAFWSGLVGTSPLWIYFILNFISPALHDYEKKRIFPFITTSLLFLFAGFLFAYFLTIPLANQYLSSFNQEIGANLWSLTSYIDYTIILLLTNALAFEFCAILLFLVHYGAISAVGLIEKRKIAIICAFIIGAVFTPPDIFTQFMLAIPLIGMYELSILYAKFISHK